MSQRGCGGAGGGEAAGRGWRRPGVTFAGAAAAPLPLPSPPPGEKPPAPLPPSGCLRARREGRRAALLGSRGRAGSRPREREREREREKEERVRESQRERERERERVLGRPRVQPHGGTDSVRCGLARPPLHRYSTDTLKVCGPGEALAAAALVLAALAAAVAVGLLFVLFRFLLCTLKSKCDVCT